MGIALYLKLAYYMCTIFKLYDDKSVNPMLASLFSFPSPNISPMMKCVIPANIESK